MDCRPGCGACCVAPSISSSIPGMPHGKPAGERCVHLTESNLCAIFESPLRPQVCGAFRADIDLCGGSREDAIRMLGWLERETA
ncbi:YkgJ family cysteine cluster protein [Stutzerimonas marianensis]|uniref:YkgJ family cysteine cluster protein n=1 Tax=Stutzerimonas marianensis TaxID=2929513 RepID=A0A9X2AUB4_9GAMM|nr:YkgJ family cysteine cluster protein [Pseudomonas marianensis]MCJ0973342.1 YkgJ family cysteine cluster protein [Pseudomonas marianensis]